MDSCFYFSDHMVLYRHLKFSPCCNYGLTTLLVFRKKSHVWFTFMYPGIRMGHGTKDRSDWMTSQTSRGIEWLFLTPTKQELYIKTNKNSFVLSLAIDLKRVCWWWENKYCFISLPINCLFVTDPFSQSQSYPRPEWNTQGMMDCSLDTLYY